jgi:prepilin-type N-terminal cleavage/methylation domain-containing protein
MHVKGNLKLWWGKQDEQGMTLVEILIAVSIMSIISVTIMGYFVSAIEKSADQSRRVIAANLARMKMAEIRQVFRDDLPNGDSPYGVLEQVLTNAPNNKVVYANDDSIKSEFTTFYPDFVNHPFFKFKDSRVIGGQTIISNEINGTYYRYLVGFDLVPGTNVSNAIGANVKDYLIALNVTVYWMASETNAPSGKYSTAFQSYVVKRK